MKHPLIILLALLAISFTACSSHADPSEDYEAGKAAAREALLKHDKIMEKENGLLEIRGRESALRARGLHERADAYVRGAQEIVDSVLNAHPE